MGNILSLVFGAMAAPLTDQLNEQGFGPDDISSKDVLMYQKDADSITRLAVRGLIPEGVVRSARQRLLTRISKHIKERMK